MSEHHQPSSYSQSILLVDDEPFILSALKRLLRKKDYHVDTASSAEQALDTIKAGQPDLIICDARMPEMDGIQLLSRVAASYPQIERILLTGYSDLATTVEAINNGKISYYIQKPWDDGSLLEVVDRAMTLVDLRNHNLNLQQLVAKQNKQLQAVNTQLEKKVSDRTKALQKANAELDKKNTELKQSYHNFIELFSSLLNSRVYQHEDNSEQASQLCLSIARSLGSDERELTALHYAARLRHIGLISLPDRLIHTPYYNLSDKDRSEYQSHPLIAHSMLTSQPALEYTAEILLQYRERVDGNGYPQRLAGHQTLLQARILKVVDDYLALLLGTLTGESLPNAQALTYIEARIGTEYDENVVCALKYTVEGDAELVDELRLESFQLMTTMMLTRDLVNKSGTLLLAKGTRLDQTIIDKIIEIERRLGDRLVAYVCTASVQ